MDNNFFNNQKLELFRLQSGSPNEATDNGYQANSSYAKFCFEALSITNYRAQFQALKIEIDSVQPETQNARHLALETLLLCRVFAYYRRLFQIAERNYNQPTENLFAPNLSFDPNLAEPQYNPQAEMDNGAITKEDLGEDQILADQAESDETDNTDKIETEREKIETDTGGTFTTDKNYSLQYFLPRLHFWTAKPRSLHSHYEPHFHLPHTPFRLPHAAVGKFSPHNIISLARHFLGQPVWASSKFASLCHAGYLGCAATVSKLLQMGGLPITGSASVESLVSELKNMGWRRVPITDKAQFQRGDIVYGLNGAHAHIGIITAAENGKVLVCDNSSSSGTLKERTIENGGSFTPNGRFAGHLYVLRMNS